MVRISEEEKYMIPYSPPSFLEECSILFKRIEGKKTWKSKDGKRLYQWDSQHGDVEVYSAKNGVHLGSADKITGRTIKAAVKGRKLSDV